MSDVTHRAVARGDLEAIRRVVAATALFPPEMLDDMIAPFLGGEDGAIWLMTEAEGEAIAMAYCAPEELADGTWNLLAIAVAPARHGAGVGAGLVAHLEDALRARGARVLIVETSGQPAFARARAVYERLGYAREAVIRDFWAEGDDKIVFWKKLR